jgi:hypothetical protein
VRTLDQRSRIALELGDRHDVLELHDAILDPNPVRSHSAGGIARAPNAWRLQKQIIELVLRHGAVPRVRPRPFSSKQVR